MHGNKKWTAVVLALVIVAGIVAIAAGAFSTGRPTARPMAPRPSSPHSHTLRPAYNPPSPSGGPNSAQQRRDDAKIAASNDDPVQWSVIETLDLPAAHPSARFPAIPHIGRQETENYATAFVGELLTITFATDSRPALLSWAVSETSPDTMPGTPASAGAKVLYADLAGSGSPVPTSTAWAANAAAGVTWSVSNVTVSAAPIWTQALATGWQPPDPRMDDLDVTGILAVTQTGQPPIVKPFSLQLGLGTAEYHDGCGAMSLNAWRLG
jgi:hypothetical protein